MELNEEEVGNQEGHFSLGRAGTMMGEGMSGFVEGVNKGMDEEGR